MIYNVWEALDNGIYDGIAMQAVDRNRVPPLDSHLAFHIGGGVYYVLHWEALLLFVLMFLSSEVDCVQS